MRWWHEYVLEHEYQTSKVTMTGNESGLQVTLRVRECSCGRAWLL